MRYSYLPIGYLILLCTVMNEATLTGVQNSEYDANMNELARYYSSQVSNVEEPEYLLQDTVYATSTELHANLEHRNDLTINILSQTDHQPSEDQMAEKEAVKYPEIWWTNQQQRCNAKKRNVDNSKYSSRSTINEKKKCSGEIEKKIKEMDMADDTDMLIALFISILKKQYPQKLQEMREILSKMTSTGQLQNSNGVTRSDLVTGAKLKGGNDSSDEMVGSTVTSRIGFLQNSTVGLVPTTNAAQKSAKDYEYDYFYNNEDEEEAGVGSDEELDANRVNVDDNSEGAHKKITDETLISEQQGKRIRPSLATASPIEGTSSQIAEATQNEPLENVASTLRIMDDGLTSLAALSGDDQSDEWSPKSKSVPYTRGLIVMTENSYGMMTTARFTTDSSPSYSNKEDDLEEVDLTSMKGDQQATAGTMRHDRVGNSRSTKSDRQAVKPNQRIRHKKLRSSKSHRTRTKSRGEFFQ